MRQRRKPPSGTLIDATPGDRRSSGAWRRTLSHRASALDGESPPIVARRSAVAFGGTGFVGFHSTQPSRVYHPVRPRLGSTGSEPARTALYADRGDHHG